MPRRVLANIRPDSSGFACTSDTTDFRGGIWGFVPTTSGRATFTAAPALQIRWADSDLSLLETHPLTPGLLLAGATQPISVVAASTTRDNTPTPFTTPSTTTSKTSVAGFATNPTLSSTLLTSTTPLTDIVNNPTSNQLPVSASAASSSAVDSFGPAPIPPVSKGTGFLSNTGAKIAVTVLLSVLLAIVLVGTGFVLIRRRQKGQGLGESLPSWLRSRPRTSQAKAGRFRQRSRDAELGSSGKTQELGPGDVLGTAAHPAELEGGGTAGAWRLRLSRILSMRSWSPAASPERHSVARTYATSSTSESTDSSDWESFVKGGGSSEPDGLGVPRMVHIRAATVRTTSSVRTARLSRDTLGVPGRNVEGRLSGGTFGRARLSTPSSRFSVPSPTPSMPSPWRAPSVHDEG